MRTTWRRRSEIPKLRLFILFLRNEEWDAPLEANSQLKRPEASPEMFLPHFTHHRESPRWQGSCLGAWNKCLKLGRLISLLYIITNPLLCFLVELAQGSSLTQYWCSVTSEEANKCSAQCKLFHPFDTCFFLNSLNGAACFPIPVTFSCMYC